VGWESSGCFGAAECRKGGDTTSRDERVSGIVFVKPLQKVRAWRRLVRNPFLKKESGWSEREPKTRKRKIFASGSTSERGRAQSP